MYRLENWQTFVNGGMSLRRPSGELTSRTPLVACSDGNDAKQKRKVGRREFLRALGAGAAAAAPLSGEARADTETNDEKRKARYKADSAHIQTYYRVNRYPAK